VASSSYIALSHSEYCGHFGVFWSVDQLTPIKTGETGRVLTDNP
jgi:hypothetical protein